MVKVLVTTVPFCDCVINPFNKKLTEDQLAGLVGDFNVVIAGTEAFTDKVMAPTRYDSQAVDTPADLAKVEQRMVAGV